MDRQKLGRIAPFVGLYAAWVLGLHLIPGPWRDWKKGREGKAIDPWLLTHVAWGVIAQRMGITRNEIVVLSTINEAVEVGVRVFRPALLWGSPERPLNSILDVGGNWVGWEVSNALSSSATGKNPVSSSLPVEFMARSKPFNPKSLGRYVGPKG